HGRAARLARRRDERPRGNHPRHGSHCTQLGVGSSASFVVRRQSKVRNVMVMGCFVALLAGCGDDGSDGSPEMSKGGAAGVGVGNSPGGSPTGGVSPGGTGGGSARGGAGGSSGGTGGAPSGGAP